ncbi:RNA 2',3'-cyclic phosphodiesterase [Alisedimentitalea sp. MJ-SS2]|uniref:RNA 2',3'-cyclic phosphodiesterase n=1 Tax=Aliisedimentitalea sp. MJ-SS2 TaxID=3049795 RepID=UPI002906DEE9|nr:RNA 2',3'-cyclic phosphodiesterase [Alisedimentitalea sp. MJ-SS2]MDU8928681.1 RNA 2',3'-cyclic phosphodiesterase [Alisedimentitalea sp. MJ-SS2]
MRAFVAIELPDGLAESLEGVQEGLPGRHVAPGNLHLTLAFLGDVFEGQVWALAERLAELRLKAPVLRVTGLDMFGGKRPNLCFASVGKDQALEAVRDTVQRTCREIGIDLRRERFRPHVTLSRFGRELGPREEERLAAQLGLVHIPEVPAERFAIYRSDLRPEGVIYTPVAEFEFD